MKKMFPSKFSKSNFHLICFDVPWVQKVVFENWFMRKCVCVCVLCVNYDKTYNNVARNSFLRVMIHSFLHVMTHASAKNKVEGKHVIFSYEAMTKQNTFHVTHIPPTLSPWRNFIRSLVTQPYTTIQSKQL